MKKQDIQDFMIIETRNDELWVVIPASDSTLFGNGPTDGRKVVYKDGWNQFHKYNDDLTFNSFMVDNHDDDIMKVYRPWNIERALRCDIDQAKLLWERPPAKTKVTDVFEEMIKGMSLVDAIQCVAGKLGVEIIFPEDFDDDPDCTRG